jgi:hypothetical protein
VQFCKLQGRLCFHAAGQNGRCLLHCVVVRITLCPEVSCAHETDCWPLTVTLTSLVHVELSTLQGLTESSADGALWRPRELLVDRTLCGAAPLAYKAQQTPCSSDIIVRCCIHLKLCCVACCAVQAQAAVLGHLFLVHGRSWQRVRPFIEAGGLK